MTDETDLGRLDAAHHLHPFTDNRILKEAGGPLVIAAGKGCDLWDENGHQYFDALAGLWCVAVGYGRRELADVAHEQIERLAYYNTFFRTTTAPTARLAAKLAELTPDGLDHAIFTNSGSEANDTIARLTRHFWALEGRPEKRVIIGRDLGYHGSTLAAISMGGITSMMEQGGLPLPDFDRIETPYKFLNAPGLPDKVYARKAARALQKRIDELGADTVAAFVAEPIQGAGGVIIPPDGYFAEIEKICRANDVLLVADEVICGFGRLGTWTGSEYFGIKPDMMALAKGLSSGYQPIAAVMVGDRVANVLLERGRDLSHGFTYSGHPVAAAVALANIEIIEREGLLARVRDDIGPYLAERLKTLEDHPIVGEARSCGFIGAVELVRQKKPRVAFHPPGIVAAVVRDQMQSAGVIVRSVGEALVFAPPLIATHTQIDRLVTVMRASLDEVVRKVNHTVQAELAADAMLQNGRSLEGRVALVTGASRGLGAAVAGRLARAGAKVVLAARSLTDLDAVANAIRETGGEAETVALDLSDPASIEALPGQVADIVGRLDILVANAAILGPIGPTAEQETEAWGETIAIDLNANFRLLRAFHDMLSASDAGRVILVSSGAARAELADWSAYAAAKAGLEALLRAYAAETANSPIRVNGVDPGALRTGMRASAFPEEDPETLPIPERACEVFVQLSTPMCKLTGAVVPVSID